jgi:hypothetical protein
VLPLAIERDYKHFRARIMHDVARVAAPRIMGSHAFRTDAKDDPQLLELAALLGISAEALVNKGKLRAKLRRFAKRLSVEKQTQLSALLGRWVREPDEALSEAWVESQLTAVSEQVDAWIARAAVSLGALAITGNLAAAAGNQVLTPDELQSTVAISGAVAATRARAGASSAVLSLNTQLLGNISQANGVGNYRWVTEDDERVRENHFDLHYTIQSWANEPAGGGTKPEDPGHPGSGFGCRCIAEPLVLLR